MEASLKEKIEELRNQERQAFQVYCTSVGQLRAFEQALEMYTSQLSEEQVDKISEINNKNKK